MELVVHRRAILLETGIGGPGPKGDPGEPVDQLGVFADIGGVSVDPALNMIRTTGYHAPGDGGHAAYSRVASEPGHAGKAQSNDGAWWELVESAANLRQFGAFGDGSSDDTAALEDLIAFSKVKGGGTILIPLGEYVITNTITLDRLPLLTIRGEGGRISTNAGVGHQAAGSVFINNTGGVLFDVVNTASDGDGSFHTNGPVMIDLAIQQLDAETDIAFRLNTQWSQPRFWRCAINGGLYGITAGGAGVQPYDIECYDTWFFSMETGCYFPDTGSSDYLHMKFFNCVWRYNVTAVEAEVGNTFHFQGGLIEENGVGLKLASVILTELSGGLHFERQTGPDVWTLIGPSGNAPKVLTVKDVTATWWNTGGQTVQFQIDDCLMTTIDGCTFARPAGAVGSWTALELGQPVNRVVDLGSTNSIDGDVVVVQAGLIVHRRGDIGIGGRWLVGGAVDNGIDRLQVRGSAILSSLLKLMGPGGITMGMKAWGGTAAYDTGILVNSDQYANPYGGGFALCMITALAGSANSTSMEIWMIRFGVNGNNIGATLVMGDPGGIGAFASYAFGVSGSGTLTITQAAGSFNNSLTYIVGGGRGSL